MFRVKLPFVDTIHPQSNKFVMSVMIKASGKSKLSSPDTPGLEVSILSLDVTINHY